MDECKAVTIGGSAQVQTQSFPRLKRNFLLETRVDNSVVDTIRHCATYYNSTTLNSWPKQQLTAAQSRLKHLRAWARLSYNAKLSFGVGRRCTTSPETNVNLVRRQKKKAVLASKQMSYASAVRGNTSARNSLRQLREPPPEYFQERKEDVGLLRFSSTKKTF